MCTSCSRRVVLATLAATLSGRTPFPLLADDATPRFMCASLAYSTFRAARQKTMSTSGDDRLDRALISEMKELFKIFPVNPGIQYIDDDPPNAYADSRTLVPGTNGTVYIGLNLLKKEIAAHPRGGISAAGICAHECAHIYQFNSPLAKSLEDPDTPSGVLFELHADLLAGYYLRRRGWRVEDVETFGNSLFGIGDYAFNNPTHHGTPAQRVSAMREGYSHAIKEASFENCAADSIAFVKSLTGRMPLKKA